MTQLLVDSNDATMDPSVLAALRARFGVDSVSITSLAQGDVSVTLDTGVLLVERKRPSDLLGSINDGRIFQQAQRMVGAARFAVVLIQGSLGYTADDYVLTDGRRTGHTGKSVRAALRAIQWAGCAVDYCAQGEFAKAVEELIALASKPDHYHLPQDKLRAPPIDFFGGQSKEEMQRVAMLASFPGIGPKRAQSLLSWIGANYIFRGNITSDARPVGADGVLTDTSKFGRLCDALEWATMLGTFPKLDRPDGWGDGNIGKLRLALDLHADEHLVVERTSNPALVQELPIIEDPADDTLSPAPADTSPAIVSQEDSNDRTQHSTERASTDTEHTQAPTFGVKAPAAPRKNSRRKQPKLF